MNNNNKSNISSNCGRLQDLILLFKITMGKQNYFKIYRNLGITLKKFCQPCTRQIWPHTFQCV